MDPVSQQYVFLKQSLSTGMEFKSKDSTFRFISLNHNTVTILFYDRKEDIPLPLFYQVLIEDNQDIFVSDKFK